MLLLGGVQACAGAQGDAPEDTGQAEPVEETVGTASYYADRFDGKPTSTGETYYQDSLTAASKDLAYNTVVRVTNTDNGRSVRVRINDCGPHHPERIIDLSGAAARRIGLVESGTATVRLRVLEPGADGPTCQ